MNLFTTFFWHTARPLNFLKRAVFACSLFTAVTSSAYAESIQQQIIGTSTAFLEHISAQYLQDTHIAGRFTVKIGRLDPRLRLPACSIPLQASLESPAQPIGRVTVRVRCDSHTPWTIFVPGHVNVYRDVAIAVRSIPRNSIVQAADVQMTERDISSLRQGYIVDLDNVVGKKITRPIPLGRIISANTLKTAAAIDKGDAVVISAYGNSMSVRMPGMALEEGAIGQQIRVRNTRSQRIVHGRVTAPGHVEVAM